MKLLTIRGETSYSRGVIVYCFTCDACHEVSDKSELATVPSPTEIIGMCMTSTQCQLSRTTKTEYHISKNETIVLHDYTVMPRLP